jgi:hypothetical protein
MRLQWSWGRLPHARCSVLRHQAMLPALWTSWDDCSAWHGIGLSDETKSAENASIGSPCNVARDRRCAIRDVGSLRSRVVDLGRDAVFATSSHGSRTSGRQVGRSCCVGKIARVLKRPCLARPSGRRSTAPNSRSGEIQRESCRAGSANSRTVDDLSSPTLPAKLIERLRALHVALARRRDVAANVAARAGSRRRDHRSKRDVDRLDPVRAARLMPDGN